MSGKRVLVLVFTGVVLSLLDFTAGQTPGKLYIRHNNANTHTKKNYQVFLFDSSSTLIREIKKSMYLGWVLGHCTQF